MFNNQSGDWLKKWCESNYFSIPQSVDYLYKTKNTRNGRSFVSAERFELSTNGLKGRCSAVELRARHNSGLHSNMGNFHRQRKTL